MEEEINATPNKKFCHDSEIVIRVSEFISERTFGTGADKAAKHINREMIEKLKCGEKGRVEIYETS